MVLKQIIQKECLKTLEYLFFSIFHLEVKPLKGAQM